MHFAYSIIRIVIIDLVLSGDNAVVIGMAAHRLPTQQRRQAILIGGCAAIALRMLLTAIAALLLTIPGLQLVGGLLLISIAFKLLKEEEESQEGVKIAGTMREAIITILVADFVMSTDNVLGVAGASNGHVGLLLFGLVFSMAILMWMGSLVANLINRFIWLSYIGAAVIAWTGALMVFEDPLVLDRAAWLTRPVAYASAAIITITVTAFAHWFHRVRGAEQD
jgi:YjbE family integral membrane protein